VRKQRGGVASLAACPGVRWTYPEGESERDIVKTRVGLLLATCLALGLGACSSGSQFAATPVAGVTQNADRNNRASAAGGKTSFAVLYSFQNGADGAVPATSLIADKSGNLYGTATNAGGAGSCNVDCGSVFELSPPASRDGPWTFMILHSFKGGRDGGLPAGNLMFGPDGTLYGTANVGGRYGKYGFGVLFQLKPSKQHWTEKVLHDFGHDVDGSNPHGGLVADGAGNLYGTTVNGGKYSSGTVYEMSPAGNTETVLYNFSGGEDGGGPLAGLAIGRGGRLYGTTEWGGYFSYYCQGGCGTVFEVSPPSAPGSAWKYAVIHEFVGGSPGDGALPLDPLLLDRAGNLYGTTFVSQVYGGGTAFELTPAHRGGSWTETVLYRFPAYRGDAANSQAGFISDGAGNLYATSQNGGATYKGDAFKLIPPATPGGTWTDAILHTFISAKHGAIYPATNLVFGAGGFLYGTTPYGGAGNCVFVKVTGCGTIFEVHP
jgi:uncharacterized repeat protein (TIGR03803 family)